MRCQKAAKKCVQPLVVVAVIVVVVVVVAVAVADDLAMSHG